ncbi:hypothetical protein ACVW0Y_001474 [Pseudomonas sp. TE3786]
MAFADFHRSNNDGDAAEDALGIFSEREQAFAARSSPTLQTHSKVVVVSQEQNSKCKQQQIGPGIKKKGFN